MKVNKTYNYIERINNLLRVDSRKKGAEYGLQPIQLEALHYLSICNKYSNSPMAVTEYLGQTKGTVSQTLKVLENKKYISKHNDASDKRITHLQVTTQGHNVLKASIPTPKFIRAYEKLPDEIQGQVESALNHLLVGFINSNEMKTFGVCSSCKYHQEKKDKQYFCGLVNVALASNEINLICREHQLKP